MKKIWNDIRNTTPRRILILAVTAVLLACAMVFGYQIEKFSALHMKGITIAALVGMGFIIFLFLWAMFVFFDNIRIKQRTERQISGRKVFFLVFAILMFLYFISFLALYPGLFVFDAKWQYDMYTGVETFTEHHPVLHTLLMGYLIDTVYQMTGDFNWGVVVYTMLQIVVCSASFSYMITYTYKKIKSPVVMVVSILFVTVHPAMVLQVMSATKDTMFLAFLMLNLVLSLELAEGARLFLKNWVKSILWVISAVLMVIFRNNCLYAVPFLLILLFVFIKYERKRFIGLLVAVAALFLLYKGVLVPAVTTGNTDGREMLSVPIQQLMRIYHSVDSDITDEEILQIENLFSEFERACYDPKIADYPKVGLDMEYYEEHKAEINEMYLNLIKRNPKMSIESVVANTCGFWYPFSRLAWTYHGTGYWIVTDFSKLTEADSKIPLLYEYYKGFETYDFAGGKPITMLICAPATYFYIFFVMFAYVIEQKKKGKIFFFQLKT